MNERDRDKEVDPGSVAYGRTLQTPIPGNEMRGENFRVGATRGIPPANRSNNPSLEVLQQLDRIGLEKETADSYNRIDEVDGRMRRAAMEIARYHPPVGDQENRHRFLSEALASFLQALVVYCPPGPERSTAISRAREAKMWGSAAIALEPREPQGKDSGVLGQVDTGEGVHTIRDLR